MDAFIQQLKQQLEQPLPGYEAQSQMASFSRLSNKYKYEIPEHPRREAGVLCLLYPKNNQWHVPFMQRTARKHDPHSKQISFPGGYHEEEDPDYQFTALRETNEEFGIPTEEITIIGKLTPLYIPASEFLVHPFVGYMNKQPNFQPDHNEVETIIETSVDHLVTPSTRKETPMSFSNGFKLDRVPYFDVDGQVIWGATSMMLSEFLEVVKKIV